MAKTALYRHFDTTGRLLYVGISISAGTRTEQHRRASAWFEDVTRIEIQWHPNRAAAEAAEWKAIKNEKPLYNKAFSRKGWATPEAVIVLDKDFKPLCTEYMPLTEPRKRPVLKRRKATPDARNTHI